MPARLGSHGRRLAAAAPPASSILIDEPVREGKAPGRGHFAVVHHQPLFEVEALDVVPRRNSP